MNLESIEKSRLFQGMTAKELSSCLDFLGAKEKKGMVKDMHQCENKMMNEMEQHAAGHGCPG